MPETIEVQFARLDERLQSLDRKQDEHHQSILLEIKDLKDGTSAKITDHEDRLQILEKSKINTNVALGIYISIGAFLVGLLIWHILGQ